MERPAVPDVSEYIHVPDAGSKFLAGCGHMVVTAY